MLLAGSVPRLVPRVRSSAPEGAVAGAVFGALIGGFAAAMAPDLGLVFGNEVVTGLLGAFVGASGGGLAGTLIGFGIPEPQKRRYAELAMREGYVLAVDCTDDLKLRVAYDVLDATRGLRLEPPPSFVRRGIGPREPELVR